MDPTPKPDAVAAPAPRRTRLHWILLWTLVGVALVVAAFVAGGIAFLGSEAGLRIAMAELVARSDGRLKIDAPEGSLLSTVRAQRIAWRSDKATFVATDVAVTWSPAALWSRGIVIQGLGARRIEIDVASSGDEATLPASLALPVEVSIERMAVGELDWKTGTGSGRLRGIAFGYDGGATRHRLRDVAFVTEVGTLTGNATLGAASPFTVEVQVALVGSDLLQDAAADITLSGTLASLLAEATGRGRGATFQARAMLTPFAATPLAQFTVNADAVDLRAWSADLPATRIRVTGEARAATEGFEGKIEAANALPGTLDMGRMPVATLATQFAWQPSALVLRDLAVELPAGNATGQARIPLAGEGGAGDWSLRLSGVDLKRIHSSLVTTRLSGTIAAALGTREQRVRGDLADRGVAGGIAADFAATVADGEIAVERLRARAGPSELTGRGRFGYIGARRFAVEATVRKFDPARFGDFPAGSLDGKLVADGELAPTWRVRADLAVAPGSRLAGAPLTGNARGTVSPNAIRDAAVDLTVGTGRLTVKGDSGAPNDVLTATLDAPKLAELAPYLPAAVPRPLAGALRAEATLRGDRTRGNLTLDAHGQNLQLGSSLAVTTFDAKLSLAAADATDRGDALATRRIDVDVGAAGIEARQGKFARLRARLSGTVGQHSLDVALLGEQLDARVKAQGGVREQKLPNGISALAWSGTLDTLENRGPWTLHLAAPAPVELGRGHVRAGPARLAVADGRVDLAELIWDDGRLTTSGVFTGVPLLTFARLAGQDLPIGSTLTLGGDWSIRAEPRLNGALAIRREAGDVYLDKGGGVGTDKVPLGIDTLALAAQIRDDAIDATGTYRSARSGSVDLRLAIGSGSEPGRITGDAPLAVTATGELSTLRVVQPWLGTTSAIDGRVRFDLAARGTVADAPWSGTIEGDGLRVDAPAHGVHYTNGRLRARAAEGRLVLGELSLEAGAGKFVAAGTIASARVDTTRAVSVDWRATQFRAFNRPDLRLVVSGAGTLAIENRRLLLAGKLEADEGHIEYESVSGATLGSDVVVEGWPTRPPRTSLFAETPLALDLDLDFGNKLRFTGEGLDTGLRGKVHVTTSPNGQLLGKGAIRAVGGTYYAFGQRLVIDRGRLIFDGPLDNPGLDIVALRRNQAVEAGIALTGTARVPIVQLTSNPVVPDGEKLSWLVTGQGLDRTSGADMAALSAASAAIFGRGGRPITTTIAQRFGLDDISFGSAASAPTAAGSTGAAGQTVAFGKRLSDRISLVYEQGLTVATNALRLEYHLSRTLTLRAEAGTISGVGIFYRRSFE
jgi:translocation and assembly module TamB